MISTFCVFFSMVFLKNILLLLYRIVSVRMCVCVRLQNASVCMYVCFKSNFDTTNYVVC